MGDDHDRIPDVRDGLTRVERVVLWQLHEAQKERGGRNVPTAMLYGRVVEHVNITVEELQKVLARLARPVEASPAFGRRCIPARGVAPPSDTSVSSVVAPCERGASAPSVRRARFDRARDREGPVSGGPAREDALAREAVRVYRRYAVEVVEGLGFCPYAERARLDGHTREIVLAAPIPSDEEVLGAIEAVAGDPAIEIGLLLFPRLAIGPAQHGRWVEHLRKAHTRARGAAVLALEGFHPHAEPDTSSPERLTPFVRRTPDPTVQLTRLSALDRVRRGTPQGTAFVDPSALDLGRMMESPERRPLHERIAEQNLETVRRLGAEEVTRIFEAILRDRDASYRAIDPDIAPRQ